MQSPLSERVPNATYRITPLQMDELPKERFFSVQVFGLIGLTNESVRLYRFDMLPQWMQEAVRALDVAGNQHVVAGLGKKVGGTYWILPESVDSALFGL